MSEIFDRETFYRQEKERWFQKEAPRKTLRLLREEGTQRNYRLREGF